MEQDILRRRRLLQVFTLGLLAVPAAALAGCASGGGSRGRPRFSGGGSSSGKSGNNGGAGNGGGAGSSGR